MSSNVEFDLCPETGIGCLMFQNGDDSVKIDLMPDEAVELKNLVRAGDFDGAKTLVAAVDSQAAGKLDQAVLQELAKEIG